MIKKPSQKIIVTLLLTTLVVILAFTLSACDLFNYTRAVRKVSIEMVSSLVDSDKDGIYEIECGKEFTLSANWHDSLISSPKIQWYISNGGTKEAIDDATTQKLTYSFSDVSETIYTITAEVEGIDSSNYPGDEKGEYKSISLKVKNATLATTEVSISSNNYDIIQNVIQIDINSSTINDVNLQASWNAAALPSDWVIDCVWYVDGDEESTGASLILDVSKYTKECSVTIKAELSSVKDTNKAYGIITLSFVKKYKEVDSVTVSMASSSGFTHVTGVTYYKEGMTECEVSLSATVTPNVGTKLTNPCVWTRTASNGSDVVSVTSRVASIPLKYGKNVITATVDNVESRQIIIYLLSNEHYNARKYAITQTFIWQGSYQDHYINNQEDLNILFGYMASLHKEMASANLSDENAHDVYLAPSEWTDWNNYSTHMDNYKEALSLAATNGLDESGTFTYAFSETKLGFTACATGIPTGAAEKLYTVTQKPIATSLVAKTQSRVLAVDSYKETLTVYNSNDLYRAVSNGYKPVFAGDNKEDLESLYNKARTVLNTYVTDSMSDLNKVRAIFEWIINYVEYDKSALTSTSSDKHLLNAFYLEGVFNDNRAVCDGKSKAFALLCGMEGIKAVRVVGYANESLANNIANWAGAGATQKQIISSLSSKGWGHAWNKVLLDANGDGVKEWYNVDTTWSDLSVAKSTYEIEEYLTYDYFLKTDAQLERTHITYQTQPEANTTFDAYGTLTISYNGAAYSLKITSTEQANYLLSYSKANGGICLIVDNSKGILSSSNKSINSRASWSQLSTGNAVVLWYS